MQGLSVVIPNYNGISLLPETLPTVFDALRTLPFPSEVIVSDDASTDGSPEWVEAHYPDVRIVRAEKNGGFSRTANRGVAAARHELVLLLNSDVKLTPGYFDAQLPFFEKPDTFGTMGRIVGWEDDVVQEGAKYPYFHGVKIKTSGNYLLEDEADMRDGLESIYLSGANMLFRRSYYDAVGGLNELFSPFYVEDYELCLRAWRSGYTCYYVHASVCRHRTSSTIRTQARKREIAIIYNRNKMLLHALHLPRRKRYLYFLQLIPETMYRLLGGQWTFVQALSQLLDRYEEVRKARAKFLLNAKGGRLLSVSAVADRILQSIKHKKVIRF
ncbi:MAG: glycosyltransferase family 2 protein [Sphingobacteriales bacterium]|nr:MAG: glycosyltransferase family 2 protein [Sphingobacteriales bacterium]